MADYPNATTGGTHTGTTLITDYSDTPRTIDDSTPETDALRSDIEHTRQDISDTLEALKEKLSPQVLMEQAKEHAKEVASDALDHAKESVKDEISHKVEDVRESVSDAVHNAADTVGEVVHNVSETVSNAVQTAKDKVGDLLGTSKEKVSDAVDTARINVNSAARTAQQRMGGVMEGAKGAGTTILDTVKNNPIPASVIGVGALYLYLKHRDDNKTPGYQSSDYDYTDYDAMYPPTEPIGGLNDMEEIIIIETEDDVDRPRGSSVSGDYNLSSTPRSTSAPTSGSTLLDTIQRNPLPAALAVVGLTWLALQNREQNSKPRYTSYTDYEQAYPANGNGSSKVSDVIDSVKGKVGDVSDTVSGAVSSAKDKVGDVVSGAKDKVSDVVGTAKDKAGDLASTVKDKAGDVADSAKSAVSTARDRTVQVAGQAREKVSTLSSSAVEHTRAAGGAVADTYQDNPMAYGLVALGLGAAVGLLLPGTEQENRFLGAKRDQLVDQATSTVQDLAHKVQTVAENTLDAAKTTVAQEAKNQGLTVE